MNEVQTMSYTTTLRSLSEIQEIRKLLDNNKDIEYWYLDINSPENKLTLMGTNLEAAIKLLKSHGFIAEID